MPPLAHRGQWAGFSRALDRLLVPAPFLILVMALVLLAADELVLRIGAGFLQEGPADETAHLLTGALVLAALPRVPSRAFAVGLLAASVAIDLDHVPGLLGAQWLTRTTQRPYPHSLLTLALVGLLAFAWLGRRKLLVGVAIGLTAHFIRDLSESSSGVPLLWPWSSHAYTLPHWTYQGAMTVVVVAALARARRRPATGSSG